MAKINARRLRHLCLKRVISIKGFCALRHLLRKQRPSINYARQQFDFRKYTDDDCLLYFRFNISEISLLLKALKIPQINWLQDRTKFTGTEGLCILLRRLSYPIRLCDMVSMFGRDAGTIGRIINFMLAIIYPLAHEKLSAIQQPYLTNERISELAENCSEAGCPYPNIIGFIDGTARRICRPTYDQKTMYSGYKKQHVVKYQSVVLSNGLIGRLDGPFAGRRHDAAILHLSGLLNEMETSFVNQDGTWYALYGDVGYANQKFIKVGYKNHHRLTGNQKEFNATMSALRVSVEYGFGLILSQFAYLDFHKNQQLYLVPIKQLYFVSALLTNLQSCMRQKNQVADIFRSPVPSLSEYLA